MEENKNLRTITGIVYSSKKDDNGKIISVIISALDEYQDDYRVSPGKKAGELTELTGEKVKVSGIVSEDTRGDLIVDVKDFILLKES